MRPLQYSGKDPNLGRFSVRASWFFAADNVGFISTFEIIGQGVWEHGTVRVRVVAGLTGGCTYVDALGMYVYQNFIPPGYMRLVSHMKCTRIMVDAMCMERLEVFSQSCEFAGTYFGATGCYQLLAQPLRTSAVSTKTANNLKL